MSLRFCGTTAFQLHRMPPQVRALYGPSLRYETRAEIRSLNFIEPIDGISLPLHTLVTDAGNRRTAKQVISHVWSGELPLGAFWYDEELCTEFASPLFSLLTSARTVSVYHLSMMAFELCGAFSVYRPAPDVQARLNRLENQRLIWPGGWRQVRDHAGEPTSLWQRDPLIEQGELHRFLRDTSGMQGHKQLAQALDAVTGVCASPLEVQASMLLGLSRRMGGEGLRPFHNNHRIPLTIQARKLADQSTCYADLFFEANELHGDIDIECHGHLIHDGGTKALLDANRALGLQSMGVDVLLLTAEQLYDQQRFNAFAQHLCQMLKIRRRPKSPAMLDREQELRRELFIDWETLGCTSL